MAILAIDELEIVTGLGGKNSILPPDPDETLPGSFPIDPDPDSKKAGGDDETLPGSFPIDPDPDSKKAPQDDETLPGSFPIDPDPDSTKSGS
ncbi:MAG: hypothetical protein ABIQ44_08565 [Chloroflexia bacterium]